MMTCTDGTVAAIIKECLQPIRIVCPCSHECFHCENLYTLFGLFFPLCQRDGSAHHIPQTRRCLLHRVTPDVSPLYVHERYLSVSAGGRSLCKGWSPVAHVGRTHEERFKRTLMLNEIWQEDEELIPGCRRLIRL